MIWAIKTRCCYCYFLHAVDIYHKFADDTATHILFFLISLLPFSGVNYTKRFQKCGMLFAYLLHFFDQLIDTHTHCEKKESARNPKTNDDDKYSVNLCKLITIMYTKHNISWLWLLFFSSLQFYRNEVHKSLFHLVSHQILYNFSLCPCEIHPCNIRVAHNSKVVKKKSFQKITINHQVQ